ncbi:Restriction endonuclease [compost metagenome]
MTRREGAADLELQKAGQRALVAAKRWKATRTGIEPLKDLAAAAQAQDVSECIYVISGELSDNARKFAEKSKIKLLRGADLVKLARD